MGVYVVRRNIDGIRNGWVCAADTGKQRQSKEHNRAKNARVRVTARVHTEALPESKYKKSPHCIRGTLHVGECVLARGFTIKIHRWNRENFFFFFFILFSN